MQKYRNRGSRDGLIEHLESRRVLSNTTTDLVEASITIGVPSLKDITFVAPDGRKTTLRVTGATAAITFPEPATLTFDKGHAFFHPGSVATISSIVVANALPGKATLKEVGAFSSVALSVGLIAGGDMGAIIAPDVALTGSITLSSVKRLALGQAYAATMSLGSAGGVVTIDGPFSGSLTAGRIGSLSAVELAKANITTTDPFSRTKLEIGSIDGGLGILDSNINSAGNIGSVKAAALQGSVINAAIPLNLQAPATIRSVKISSKSIKSPAIFYNSAILADSIGSVQLGQLDGGGSVGGLSIGSFKAIEPSGAALDGVQFHLGPHQLSNATRLRAALTHLKIPFTPDTTSPYATVFYGFHLGLFS